MQAMRSPQPGRDELIVARRREVELTFYWQMNRCESFRSLPNIEMLFSEIMAAIERQFRSTK